MNEIYKFEENELIIADKVINAIKDLEKQKQMIKNSEDIMKTQLIEAMSKYGKDKWESPDGTLKVAYTPEIETLVFDTKRFQEEHHDLYVEYQKDSKRKASVRITVKDK